MNSSINFIIKHKYKFILLSLILVSFLCQTYQINRDLNGFHEYGSAHQIFIVKNLLKHGIFNGPITNTNPLNGQFSYYLYHPYFHIYFYAIIFKLIGSSIIIGRLISLLIFYGSTICLYLLVNKLWSAKIAAWTAFFYLFFPISQYFSKIVGPLYLVTAFMLLFVLFYNYWIKHEEKKYLYLMVLFYLLACLTEWVGYFIAPVIIFHYIFILKKRNRNIFILPLVGALTLAITLITNYFFTGSLLASQSQWPNGNITIGAENQGLINHVKETRMDFSLLFRGSYYKKIFSHWILSFTLPIVLLVAYFFLNFKKYRRVYLNLFFILSIGIIYFLNGLPQPKALSDHEFWTVLLAGSFAVICAVLINKMGKKWKIIFAASFLVFSFSNTKHLYTLNNTNQENVSLGKSIHLISKPNEGIAVSKPYFSPFIEYFGQRKILYDVTNWDKLNFIIKNSDKIKYFITNRPDYAKRLTGRYSATFLPYNFTAFNLQGKKDPSILKKDNIMFANGISLIGYSFKRLPDNHLLLSYRWKKRWNTKKPFMVFVHFGDAEKKIHNLFGQDHYLITGNRIINENYLIKIPKNGQGKKLSVHIGLYSPVTGERVRPLNRTSKNDRIYLGTIKK
jgi:Dolichyl-phosphate-mannose-protein mannosyltransferase